MCDMVKLSIISEKYIYTYNVAFGIYRDNGLVVIQSKSLRTAENAAKENCYIIFLINGV